MLFWNSTDTELHRYSRWQKGQLNHYLGFPASTHSLSQAPTPKSQHTLAPSSLMRSDTALSLPEEPALMHTCCVILNLCKFSQSYTSASTYKVASISADFIYAVKRSIFSPHTQVFFYSSQFKIFFNVFKMLTQRIKAFYECNFCE